MPIREAEILWGKDRSHTEPGRFGAQAARSRSSPSLGRREWGSQTARRARGADRPAHASCFAMALAPVPGENHAPLERLAPKATCTLDEVDGAPRITTVALDVRPQALGLEQADFAQHVARGPASARSQTEVSVQSEFDR